MKSRDYLGWILLVMAVGLGVLAYFLTQRYLAQESARLAAEAAQGQGTLRPVVVASRDLLPGDLVDDASMAIAQLPARHLSHRSVSPQDYKALRGHVLTRGMVSGEPLLRDFVSGAVIERFSDLIRPGDRALSLEVTSLENHAGMLVPGDFIDLMVEVRPGHAEPADRLVPVLERVRVVAAGPEPLRAPGQGFQPISADEQRYRMISIVVTQTEAERVLQAQSQGTLRYLLRNARDDQTPSRDAGRRFFGDAESSNGYTYFSNGAPLGRLHQHMQALPAWTPPMAPPPSHGMSASLADAVP